MGFADHIRAAREQAAQERGIAALARQSRAEHKVAGELGRERAETEGGRRLQIASRLAQVLRQADPPYPTNFVLRTETYRKERRWTGFPPHRTEVEKTISTAAVNGWVLDRTLIPLRATEAWDGRISYPSSFSGVILGETGTIHQFFSAAVDRNSEYDRTVPSEVTCRLLQLPDGRTSGRGPQEMSAAGAASSPNIMYLMARLAAKADVDPAIFE